MTTERSSEDTPSRQKPSPTTLPPPAERNFTWRIIQWFCQLNFAAFLRFRQRGRKHLPASGALLVANHQSFLDPLLIGVALDRPVSFLARDTLFRVPVIGWILRATYVMPIRRDSAGSVREPIERLKHGFYVGVFPEGTRTDTGQVGVFKPGFVSLVRRSKVPVVPVGIAGAFEAYPRTRPFPLPGRVRVVYGEPIPSDEVAELARKGNEQKLIDRVTNEVRQLVEEAQGWRDGNLDVLEDDLPAGQP